MRGCLNRLSSGPERSEDPSRDHFAPPLAAFSLVGRSGISRWSSGPERSEDPSRDHFAQPSGTGDRGGPAAYTIVTSAGGDRNYCRGLALASELCTWPRSAGPRRAFPLAVRDPHR
ncbi:hypothetical protein A5788_10020 [Gordonia sp. 852002-50816_SCH5313054-c]|nr:hypothetical protein A5785_12475 [Gordonia sp. 852002-50395_SCH5434458]OBC14817.1 hypothetical protein A5786_22175 [Gordonia sp. 852002-50816_SCH5313054-a]OBC18440.1 hypothetical protein A5788_10020 [Gordonia sp. 852002-50816_SCH5313054-c]